MSPEDKLRIVLNGESSKALDNMGIEATGDNRPPIEILELYNPELARELSLRAKALLEIEV